LSPTKDARVARISVFKIKSQKIIIETVKIDRPNSLDISEILFLEVKIKTTRIAKIMPIFGPNTSSVLLGIVEKK